MPYDPETGLETTLEQLESSPTAYNNAVQPTKEDVALDRKRMAVEKSIASAENKRLQERWYGSRNAFDKSEAPQTNEGFFAKSLNTLATPSKAVVGTAQYVKGKVTGEDTGTLGETINRNIKPGGEMWGGFLQSLGAPHFISAPIGFMMDIAFDPLNIAMMGTSSLVGKTAYGASKAGLKGAGLALKESAVRTGYNVLKRTPFFSLPKSAEGAEQIAAGAYIKNLPKSNVLRLSWEKEASKGMKMRAFTLGLGEKALKTGEQFDTLTGRNFMDILQKEAKQTSGPWKLPFRPSEQVEAFFKKNGWDDVVKAVKYSPQEFGKAEKLRDLERIKLRATGRLLDTPTTPEDFKEIDRFFDEFPLTKRPASLPGDTALELSKIPPEARHAISEMEKAADDARGVLAGEESIIPSHAVDFENANLKVAATENKVEQAKAEIERLRATGINPTGFKKYDDFVEKFAEATRVRYKDKIIPVGEKVMKFMDLSNKWFAMFKVAMSPTAYVNGIIGNPVMAHLLGLNVFDPGYFGSINGARRIMTGKADLKFLAKLEPFLQEIRATVEKMPGYAHQTLGIDARTLEAMQHRFVISDAKKMAAKAGQSFDEKIAEQMLRDLSTQKAQAVNLEKGKQKLNTLEAKLSDLKKAKAPQGEIAAAKKEVDAQLVANAGARGLQTGLPEEAVKIGTAVEKAKFVSPQTPAELAMMTKEKLAELGLKKSDIPRDFVTEEIFGGSMAALLKNLKKTSEGSGLWANTAGFLYAAGTKPGSWYSKIDSVYKLGTWHHLIANGLTEGELRLVSRVVPSVRNGVVDTVGKGAELRYMLSPEVALDVVNEAYMQYAAMPNVVNFLKGLPILGSTFISFPYAMTTKVAKAVAYNPQAFNKVQFLLQEVGGRKTPSEKEALKSEFYSQLNSPWQRRIPLLKDNPLYLNLANAIPFATLNSFMPSERHFQNPTANIVAQAIDRSPFFKNPWGGAMLDTMILPMFLHGEEAPQGYFGQRIWPTDATGLQKVGYGARNLGEAFTPAVAGYAGLAAMVAPQFADPRLVELSPLSKYRSMVYATQGKSGIGVQTKESPLSKTVRTGLRQAGLGFTPLKTTYSKK